MPICEQCSAPLVQPERGRPRRYCSDVCRKRAQRERESFTLPAAVLADPVDSAALRRFTAEAISAELENAEPGDVISQLVVAVSETQTLAHTYKRLAKTTPRNLAWRSAQMGEHLSEGLDRLFTNREDKQ